MDDFEHVVSASEFRRLGYEVIDWMADYMERGLEQEKHVRPDLKVGRTCLVCTHVRIVGHMCMHVGHMSGQLHMMSLDFAYS